MRALTRRAVACTVACLAGASALGAVTPARAADREVPIAIKGYDPVAYFTLSKPLRGRVDLELEWDDHRYRFASAEHRERFRADPLRYAPQFPDLCAMSLTRGEVVEANPEYWLIANGKLYMFGKPVGPELFQERLVDNIERARRSARLVPTP